MPYLNSYGLLGSSFGHMKLECTLLMLALAGLAAAASAQSWSPKRGVEIVVGFAAGGSQDLTARTVERLLVAGKLVNVPVAVVNKPGAGGSIAYAYVSQRPADGHTLMVAGTLLISGHILGTNAFNYSDFTPVASLFNDYIAFSVNAASPLRTGADLIERLKKDPSSLTIGIISVGSGAHVAASLLLKAMGGNARDLKVVSFKAGTEVITNLLGGHIDVATNTAVVAEPHAAQGVRAYWLWLPRGVSAARWPRFRRGPSRAWISSSTTGVRSWLRGAWTPRRLPTGRLRCGRSSRRPNGKPISRKISGSATSRSARSSARISRRITLT